MPRDNLVCSVEIPVDFPVSISDAIFLDMGYASVTPSHFISPSVESEDLLVERWQFVFDRNPSDFLLGLGKTCADCIISKSIVDALDIRILYYTTDSEVNAYLLAFDEQVGDLFAYPIC